MTDQQRRADGCPVRRYTTGRSGSPALTAFSEMDDHRSAAGPVMWTEESGGHWVFTNHESVTTVLNDSELWSNAVDFTFSPEPQMMPPLMLDGEEHLKWRRLLAPWFSPAHIRSLRPGQERMAKEVIDDIAPRGQCDYLSEVARSFPPMVVLRLLGLPLEDSPMFLEIVERAVGRSDEGPAGLERATQDLMNYLSRHLDSRRARPSAPATDILSAAITWEIDGQPPDEESLLKCLTLLTVAGIDTTASQLAWTMLHLATHPDDRRRLTSSPESVNSIVEESLRLFPVAQQPRRATRDATVFGCEVRRGDNAVVAMSAAGRDPEVFENAATFWPGRDDSNSHATLGAGRHLCLGGHLARQEMAVVLSAWHEVIPDYELTAWPDETCGVVWSVDELLLTW